MPRTGSSKILLMIMKHSDSNKIHSPEGAKENSPGREPGFVSKRRRSPKGTTHPSFDQGHHNL